MKCSTVFSWIPPSAGFKPGTSWSEVRSANHWVTYCLEKISHVMWKCAMYLFALRFYGQVNQLGSCRVQSVYLTTLYWAGLVLLAVKQYLCTFLHQKLPNALLEIRGRERMTAENILWSISTKEYCRPGGGQTRNLLITSQTPSNWATKAGNVPCNKDNQSVLEKTEYEQRITLSYDNIAVHSTAWDK